LRPVATLTPSVTKRVHTDDCGVWKATGKTTKTDYIYQNDRLVYVAKRDGGSIAR